MKRRDDPQDSLGGLEGWDRMQAVADQLGVTVMRAPPSNPHAWDHLPPHESDLMRRWEASMPVEMIIPEKRTKCETMKALALTPEFVEGIPVGNWRRVIMRRTEADKPINYVNTPPLKRGDRIEVLAGNRVNWGTVGKRGTLLEFFEDDGKWGIDLDHTGEGVLVKAGNLKRLPKEERGKEACAGYVNYPPLTRGDCVEVLPPSGSAGKRGICQQRFVDDGDVLHVGGIVPVGHWGIGLEGGSFAWVRAGNLKRIAGPVEGVKEAPGQWCYTGPPLN